MEIRQVTKQDVPALVRLMRDYIVGFYQQEDKNDDEIRFSGTPPK